MIFKPLCCENSIRCNICVNINPTGIYGTSSPPENSILRKYKVRDKFKMTRPLKIVSVFFLKKKSVSILCDRNGLWRYFSLGVKLLADRFAGPLSPLKLWRNMARNVLFNLVSFSRIICHLSLLDFSELYQEGLGKKHSSRFLMNETKNRTDHFQ